MTLFRTWLLRASSDFGRWVRCLHIGSRWLSQYPRGASTPLIRFTQACLSLRALLLPYIRHVVLLLPLVVGASKLSRSLQVRFHLRLCIVLCQFRKLSQVCDFSLLLIHLEPALLDEGLPTGSLVAVFFWARRLCSSSGSVQLFRERCNLYLELLY